MADAAAVSPLSPVESHAIPAPLFPAASIFHEPSSGCVTGWNCPTAG